MPTAPFQMSLDTQLSDEVQCLRIFFLVQMDGMKDFYNFIHLLLHGNFINYWISFDLFSYYKNVQHFLIFVQRVKNEFTINLFEYQLWHTEAVRFTIKQIYMQTKYIHVIFVNSHD